ncbi:uncharacterized protein EAE98_001337 [Botrytis deweyae]|uniref:Membrane fusion mating protein FIG1 n=1 Tax=Botrytis deweyae TaxID=2478750 RepID=A0ABQ7J178_9HELO|nr:uncharacterized protein EAE98_001337 [Botrytis deweyae]KAF7939001.1 hypothetical protein EAE98_001337 [Botrytis deweyae]
MLGKVPFIGFHHVLMFFIACSIILISLLMAGCTSAPLSNVYLLSLSYIDQLSPSHNDSSKINQNVSTMFFDLVSRGGLNASTAVEVRVGFLGFCLRDPSGIWVCAKSATSLAKFVRESGSFDVDPLNVIWIAKEFQKQSLFSGLWISSIPLILVCFIILFTFPGWHDEEDSAGMEIEVRPFPSRRLSNWALILVALASFLSFVSAFWQHISSATGASMVRSLSYGTIRTVVGPAAMALAWGSVFFLFLTTFGLLIMIMSIKVLAETFG